jgi:hypothetical protein
MLADDSVTSFASGVCAISVEPTLTEVDAIARCGPPVAIASADWRWPSLPQREAMLVESPELKHWSSHSLWINRADYAGQGSRLVPLMPQFAH